MRLALLLLASLTVTPAFAQMAQSPNVNPATVRNVGIGVANSDANSASHSRASAGSRSGVNIRSGDTRIAPTAIAPGLAAAGIETCLGSFSVGGSSIFGGLSFGSTVKDDGCDTRLTARTLWSMGYRRAAVSVLCSYRDNGVNVAEAMALAGTPCARFRIAQRQPEPSFDPFGWLKHR